MNKFRILIIEDDKGQGEVIQAMIDHESGGRVASDLVETLQEAETKLEEGPMYGTISLDLMLGDSRGLETYQRIRTLCPNSYVVVYSGFYEILDQIDKMGHTRTRTIRKPKTGEAVNALLRAEQAQQDLVQLVTAESIAGALMFGVSG